MEFRSDSSDNKIDYLIKTAIDKRSNLFEDSETDCFRIFNSSGDGIDGLTADYYSGYILLQFFNQSARDMVKQCHTLLTRFFPLNVKAVLCKNRIVPVNKKNDDCLWESIILDGIYPSDGIVVKQNGIKAGVNLIHGQNTGIFLDMREVRKNLEDFYKSGMIKTMLNLFSYTALFSIHALTHGIKSSINIDLSKNVLYRARANYQLNGLNIDNRDFIYGDVFVWSKQLAKKNKSFDYIVFDPPTFARNRKRSFSVKKDYQDSLRKIELLTDHGFIFTSVNSYSVSENEYRSYHPDSWELVMFANESSDFKYRDSPYLKAGLWKI